LVKKVIGALILGLLIVSVVIAAVVGAGRGPVERSLPGGGKVGIVHIHGIITSEGVGGGPFGGGTAGISGVLEAFRRAEEDPSIKAVVIRVDSPGGTAAASQEVAQAVARVKKAGKKVVTSMGDMAASGAYWIAADSDRIFANPATITGSIGVLIQTVELTGLYGKLGIDWETFKSGPHKDMGSASRPLTPEERAIFQAMVDDIYDQFVDRVARGRGMARDEVLTLADGRVFTGRQAKEAGLVDELGDLRDAVRYAGEIAGIEGKPEVVNLGPQRLFWERLFGDISNRAFFLPDMLPAWLLCPAVIQR